MKTIDVAIKIFRCVLALGWVIVFPVCIVTLPFGGWFFLIMYWCLWEWTCDLAEDHVTLQRTADQRPLTQKLGREVDWMLARAADEHPATILVQRNGEQDIGGINGSFDLGYPPVYYDISSHFPDQMQCQDCSARFEPPYPRTCPYCKCPVFAQPSLP